MYAMEMGPSCWLQLESAQDSHRSLAVDGGETHYQPNETELHKLLLG